MDAEDNAEFIKDLATDFTLFSRNLIGVDSQQFHQDWVNIFETNKRSAMYAPRGYGKSFTLGVLFPLWKIRFSHLNGGPRSFAIISDSLPQAGNMVSAIRRILETNPYFQDLVPPTGSSLAFKEQKLELTDGSTIYVRPYSRTAVGVHVHYFLFDEASKVPDSRLYWEDLTSIVNHHDGNICLIGTPDHVNDVIDECMHNDEYETRTYKSINNGELLWPSVFSQERLDEIKAREGLTSFAKNYMCELVAHGTQVFPAPLIAEQCTDSLVFNLNKRKHLMYFTGVDLAISQNGDYMVTTTISFNLETGQIAIVDIRKTQGTIYETQLDIVQEVYETYKPIRILVDDSVYGKPFISDLIQKRYVPAEGYTFSPPQRMSLLNTLIRLFPRIGIPRGRESPETLKMTDELMHELSGFVYGQTRTGLRSYESTTAHDDMVMSLALAAYGASDYDNTKDYNADGLTSIHSNQHNMSLEEGLFDDDLTMDFNEFMEHHDNVEGWL